MHVHPLGARLAREVVEREHYLHRKPTVMYSYGMTVGDELKGVVTYGAPSHSTRKGACPQSPTSVIELNRLWVHDDQPRNTESQFVAATLRLVPGGLIVVSFADTAEGHFGTVYRALNFRYAGWTGWGRNKPLQDYVLPGQEHLHSRSSYRVHQANGSWPYPTVDRSMKIKYWITTGNRTERKAAEARCGWPSLDWAVEPPPPTHMSRNANRKRLGLSE